MKFLRASFVLLILSSFIVFSGCGEETTEKNDQPNPTENKVDETKESVVSPEDAVESDFDEVPEHASDKEIKTIRLKFIGFELGDAPYYEFEDESGKGWTFGGCEGDLCDFGIEVEPDETNQGWGSNPEYQGKWFDIEYYVDQREQYIDGPVGDVEVIYSATMVE